MTGLGRTRRRPAGWGVAAGLLLVAVGMTPLSAQVGVQSLNQWINSTADRIVASRLEQTSSSTQVEGPSVLGSSTSLVDHASASDLVGFALHPATFPRSASGDPEATSQVFTLSPYALLAALTGRDPDDPWVYQDASAWRLFSITLGLEDATNDVTAAQERAYVMGLKLKIWDERNYNPGDDDDRAELRALLSDAGAAFGRASTAVQDRLFQLAIENGLVVVPDRPSPVDTANFVNRVSRVDGFEEIMNGLSEAQQAELVDLIETEIQPFVDLREGAAEALAALRGAPQLSLSVTARMSQSARDEVRVGIAFDKDLLPGVAWTLSGGLDYREAFAGLEEEYGGTFATEVAVPLVQQSFNGAKRARLTLAAEGSFMQDQDAQARVQAKLVLPLAQGLELPISVTWASRTDLIDEAEVFGQLGFTLDAAALQRALGG